MKNTNLSKIERQMLVNQFKMLSILNETGANYEAYIEILEGGYIGEYDKVFSVTDDEVSSEICEETNQILEMYRKINNCINRLSEEEKDGLNLEKIEFEGFDANHDDHYSYAILMIEHLHKWEEYKNFSLNSHSVFPLKKYIKMLHYQNEMTAKGKWQFDKNDIANLIEMV